MEQPEDAKKMYMTMVIARAPKYMLAVEPTSKNCQALDSVASILSKQYSAHVCAKSTKRTKPSNKNSIAPIRAT